MQPKYEIWHLSLNFEAFKLTFMKKITLAVFTLGLFSFSYSQSNHSENDGHNHAVSTTPAAQPAEVLKLKETAHDFGKIPQGKPVYYTFEVVNISSTPLKLDNVSASCGCTTPEWSKDPIAAGATARIKVGFNAASEGDFEKNITIAYNSGQTKLLKIKGTVWKAPAGSAPANTSVDLLKKQKP